MSKIKNLVQSFIMRSNANAFGMKLRKSKNKWIQGLIMRSNANAFGMKRKR
jgi:hypothetical protein